MLWGIKVVPHKHTHRHSTEYSLLFVLIHFFFASSTMPPFYHRKVLNKLLLLWFSLVVLFTSQSCCCIQTVDTCNNFNDIPLNMLSTWWNFSFNFPLCLFLEKKYVNNLILPISSQEATTKMYFHEDDIFLILLCYCSCSWICFSLCVYWKFSAE